MVPEARSRAGGVTATATDSIQCDTLEFELPESAT